MKCKTETNEWAMAPILRLKRAVLVRYAQKHTTIILIFVYMSNVKISQSFKNPFTFCKKLYIINQVAILHCLSF